MSKELFVLPSPPCSASSYPHNPNPYPNPNPNPNQSCSCACVLHPPVLAPQATYAAHGGLLSDVCSWLGPWGCALPARSASQGTVCACTAQTFPPCSLPPWQLRAPCSPAEPAVPLCMQVRWQGRGGTWLTLQHHRRKNCARSSFGPWLAHTLLCASADMLWRASSPRTRLCYPSLQVSGRVRAVVGFKVNKPPWGPARSLGVRCVPALGELHKSTLSHLLPVLSPGPHMAHQCSVNAASQHRLLLASLTCLPMLRGPCFTSPLPPSSRLLHTSMPARHPYPHPLARCTLQCQRVTPLPTLSLVAHFNASASPPPFRPSPQA